VNLERSHTFSFSPGGEHFLLDGEPFQIRSGEMHPARIPREYWQHRIRMAKAMGMNCIALYIMWNYHETHRGVFDFESGNRDIASFIGLCQAEAMWVLLRPGPYVCAEWDLGGLPSYLLGEPDIRLRTDSATDARYMAAVTHYIDALVPRIKPLMIEHGGPILMIQIENEFGSYAHNPAYLEELRQLWLRGGITGPFYTEDGLAQLERNRSTVAGGAIALSNGNAAQIAAVRLAFSSVPAMAGDPVGERAPVLGHVRDHAHRAVLRCVVPDGRARFALPGTRLREAAFEHDHRARLHRDADHRLLQ